MELRDALAEPIPGNDANLIEELRKEHHEIDLKVSDLERRAFLTSDEEAEVKRLKRLKLAKKDMIYVLTRRLGKDA